MTQFVSAQPNFGRTLVNNILISHPSITFHQGSTYSCTDCSLDAFFGWQESMYRLANQQDHRYGPTERKAVIVSADGRNMLRRQLANSSSIPVQGL